VATSVTYRISEVLDYLGIERAHFAASMLADVAELAQRHPRRIASLSLSVRRASMVAIVISVIDSK